jgi:hypothetical protein
MSAIIKLFTLILCFLWIFLFAKLSILHAQEDDSSKNKPKVRIVLYKYKGAKEEHFSGAKFDVFRGIIDRKIMNIRRDIFKAFQGESDEKLKMLYLNDIYIEYKDKVANFKTPKDTYKWMENQQNILSLMKGSINSDDNIKYKVHSEIYFDELKTYFPYDLIAVELPVNDSEFSKKIDSHTLVILFALALDAKKFNLGKDKLAVILKVANDKLSDYERRLKKQGMENLPGDLLDLQKSIEDFEKSIRSNKNSNKTNEVINDNSTKSSSN